MPTHHARDATDYHMLFQETGDQIFRIPWPPTRQGFIDSFITPYVGSAVDAYCFCTNVAGTMMFYDSDVGEMQGSQTPYFPGGSSLRQHENIKQLCAAGDDPPRLAVEAARAGGMDCFLRLRMNDLHDHQAIDRGLDKPPAPPKIKTPEPCYGMSAFKREHPELLMGDPWANHEHRSQAYWESLAYNYALEPVREMYYRLAEELVTRYEPDGLQLDFLRFPFYFRWSEAYAQRHLLTDLVRRIRGCVQEVGKRCGRKIHLIADLPETVESALRTGIDTPVWLREGLVDMITIGRGYLPYSTQWEEVASVAKAAGVPSFACFNFGKLPGWIPSDGCNELGRQTLKAAAHRSLSGDVQGLFLFNYFYQGPAYEGDSFVTRPIGFDFTHDLVDREKLARGTQVYEVDKMIEASLIHTYGHTTWMGQLPLTISTGESHRAVFDLAAADDCAGGRLWLQLCDPHFDDHLEFWWNAEPITPDPNAWQGECIFDFFDYTFKLLPKQVRVGENVLEIRLQNRDPRLDPYVTLLAARLTLLDALTGDTRKI